MSLDGLTRGDVTRDGDRTRLKQARELIAQGRLAEAREILLALKARFAGDPAALEGRSLGEPTLLGLPRKLHSTFLKLAKAEDDLVRRVGLQHALVPDPSVITALAVFDEAERRRMRELSRQPVPRILHQIWLGTLPVPSAVTAWADHAARHGFEYRLWREADIAAFGLDDNAAYGRMIAEGDYPGAVDVARYAILDKLGGIYLDCDWYPARDDLGFDEVLPLLGLGAMAEKVARETGTGSLLLANSFIAAPAGHPVFAKLLEIMPAIVAAMPQAPAWWSTGPLAMTVVFRQTNVFLAPPQLVAAELPRNAPVADVETARIAAGANPDGLLIAWKSW